MPVRDRHHGTLTARKIDIYEIPESELCSAQTKCAILAGIDEDYQHIVRSLETKYGVAVRVQTVRSVVRGAVGTEKILLSEMEKDDFPQSSNKQHS